MPNTQFVTNEGAVILATAVKTLLALSKLRLTQGLAISAATTKAELVAAEATFDGYTAGGYTLTAWTGPFNWPTGGAAINSPVAVPTYGPAGDPPVGNTVSGYWIEIAAGDVVLAGNFDPTNPMTVVGNGFPFITQFILGRNAQQG